MGLLAKTMFLCFRKSFSTMLAKENEEKELLYAVKVYANEKTFRFP